jgi:hypothetical protein
MWFVGRSLKVSLQQWFCVGSLGDRRTGRGEFAVATMRGERRVDGWPTGHVDRLGSDLRPHRSDLVAAATDAGTTQYARGALLGAVGCSGA